MGVEQSESFLLSLVCAGLVGVRAQVVTEGEHALDLGMARGKAVELDEARTGSGVVERAVAAAGDAELTSPLVAECGELGCGVVERVETRDFGDEVKDGFGADSGDGGRAHVVDGDDGIAHHANHPGRFRARSCGPIGRVVNEYDWSSFGH